jgi:hypothetical protein
MPEQHYLGNPLLKKANTKVDLTEEQILELAKCSEDSVYFSKKYMKIVTLDHGLQNFNMYPFQERMLTSFQENRFNIVLCPRQVGKCFTANTIIRVRNKKTGEISEITAGEFYDKIEDKNLERITIS